ncbi:MAG: polymer-forming cytoskeletal protein [Bacillota bacterium]|nr:polymer-forming cytoskeletal protein [Bacillota bacterium]
MDKVDTLVGQGTLLKGRVEAQGTLRIDGFIEGEIVTTGDVIIGEKGTVKAQVTARNLTIGGTMEGNAIVGECLSILPHGRLVGDAKMKRLVIEEGAFFHGRSEMQGQGEGEEE